MRRIFLAILCCLSGLAPARAETRIHGFRLRPGQDVKAEIARFARERGIRAGWVVTAVGSLRELRLRLANQSQPQQWEGPWEVVSLVGTFSQEAVHLHLSASDGQGRTLGGHLVEGNLVFTTLEVVLGESTSLQFQRSHDEQTGYPELRVETIRQHEVTKP